MKSRKEDNDSAVKSEDSVVTDLCSQIGGTLTESEGRCQETDGFFGG